MSDPTAVVVEAEEQSTGLALAPNEPGFRMVVRGYDRFEVDSYIDRLHRELSEAEEQRSPSSAVRRALEQVGDEVAGILQRAHETAALVTNSARKEAEERLESSRRVAEERISAAKQDAIALTAQAGAMVRELDVDTDRIWAERDRIVSDARELARQLMELSDAAGERFPPADTSDVPVVGHELVDEFPVVSGELMDEPVDPD